VFETRTRTGTFALRALIALTASFLTVGVATVAAPVAARAADGESIAGGPCDDSGNSDGRSRFTYEAAPGQQVSDCYRVENTGSAAQTVTVYATDAFNTEGGDFALLDAAAAPTDAGGWVALEDGSARMQFDLGAGESRPVRFTLTVPADAGPGDHAGGLIVSAQTPSDQILVDRRVGTRMYVRVPGELQSLLNITGMTATYNPSLNPLDGTANVTLTVTNQGNIALAPTLVLVAKSFFGSDLSERRLENLDELLPGASRTVTYELGPVGQFVYVNAAASLYSRGDQTGATSEAPPAPQVDREAGIWAVPWILVGILLLVGLIVLYLRWRRRRDDKRAAEWMAFTQAEAERAAAAQRETVGSGA
jgi:dihydroorotate dehydrogenase (fumarate)